MECPDGKLRQPSWRVWESVSVHTSQDTRTLVRVPEAGLQRDIRSGLGRPTAFLMMSVMKSARPMLGEYAITKRGEEGE